MKRLLLLFLIVISGSYINAQSLKVSLEGKYGFIYNDQKHMVHFIPASNTFIEYDEKGNQLTDGSFIKQDDSFILTPIVKSNSSLISIPVNFKVLEELPKKIRVNFSSSEVTNRELNLYKL